MKSNIYFFLILFFFINNKTDAQAPNWLWVKQIGGSGNDYSNSMVFDSKGIGNIYLTGSFENTVDFDPGAGIFNLTALGNNDLFFTKLDSSCNLVWAKSIGATNASFATPIITFDPSGSGYIYIVGSFGGTVDFDPGIGIFNLTSPSIYPLYQYISKFDAFGNFLWAKVLLIGSRPSIPSFVSVTVDTMSSKDIYLSGHFSGVVDFDPGIETYNLTSSGNQDIYISKLDSAGNFKWAKRIGGSGDVVLESMVIDPLTGGNLYIIGLFEETVDFNPGSDTFNLRSNGLKDIFISKLDSAGNLIWAKKIGGIGGDYGFSIAVDPAGTGEIYTTGFFYETVDFDPGHGIFNLTSNGYEDIFINKLDADGNFLWTKTMGGKERDYGWSIVLDPRINGYIYTIGFFNETVDFDPGPGIFNLTSDSKGDLYISVLDFSGNFIWAKSIKGIGNEYFRGAILDAVSHLYITGFFNGSTISFDSTIITNANNTNSTYDLYIAKLDVSLATPVININSQQITIYPNPSTDKLIIEFKDNMTEQVEINVFNILGRIVLSIKDKIVLHEKIIDMSGLLNGIYFIEINSNGNRIIKKVVKE